MAILQQNKLYNKMTFEGLTTSEELHEPFAPVEIMKDVNINAIIARDNF